MRVLFNTYPVAFDVPGGGEMQLLNYRKHLPAHGVEVCLFDQWKPQFGQVQVVHFFSVWGGSRGFVAHVKARGLPLVVSASLWVADWNREQYPMGEIREIFGLADAVIPNSDTEAERLSEEFDLPRDKFQVVYNGVDERFFQAAAPEPFRRFAGLEGPFVLCVGNIEPRKNQLALVRAMKGIDLPLILVGRVREQAYFQACLAEGGQGTRHLGVLENADPLLASAYAACAVFALPSTLETPGLAALEAAAQGAAVVVTREGSAREYFGDRVGYVDPFDEGDIRRGLREALATGGGGPELAALVKERYSWERVTGAIPPIYRAAIDRCAARGG